MCGIAGFLDRTRSLGTPQLVQMTSQIARRGPDGEGHYTEGPVGLGMRRLAVIDLNGGWQPIYNEDRSVVVVFNGEIYNYRQLRARLAALGHRLSTQSDTECLVHLYEESGADLARDLEGMFAFALWDSRRRKLLLGRDRLGQKPLYVARTPTALLFGSEIKSLLAVGLVGRTINPQALDEYLAYTNVPTPDTIYRDITQVEPGCVLTFSEDGTSERTRYWCVPAVPEDDRTEAEWIRDCEAGLRAAVESHLVSDVPVGAFLSGGVDSGLMVALMADILGKPVETFTVRFPHAGSAFIDEQQYAGVLAEKYKLNHHVIDVTPDFEAIIGEVVAAFDQPFADDSVVPSYYVSKVAREHVKVALTGLGGDELFAGYRRHLGLLLGERYALVPRCVREWLVRPVVEWLPESANSSDLVDHLKRFTRASGYPAAKRYQDSLSSAAWEVRSQLYNRDVVGQLDPLATERVICGAFGAEDVPSTLERALRTDLQTYLVDDILTLSDRLSMWHSLELRVPYIDHRFVELAAHIPARLKIRAGVQKYLLKRVAERWLPHDMIYHRKQGFEAPMGHWLQGPLLPFFDATVNRESIERGGIFQFDTIKRLRDEHVARKRKHSKLLFSLLMFQLWQAHSGAALA